MKKFIWSVLSTIILSLCASCSSYDGNQKYNLEIEPRFTDLRPERVHLVDYNFNSGNFLFRGNLPISSGGDFQYEQLVEIMEQRANEQGLKLPDQFYLIDYSLLNVTEEKDLQIERDFFKNNPNLGEVQNWPLFITSPAEIDNKLVALHQKIIDPNTRNIIWYVHCEAGCDRTGIVSAGYRMRFMSKSYSQSQALNLTECGRPQNKSSTFLTKQYCVYLKRNNLIANCQ